VIVVFALVIYTVGDSRKTVEKMKLAGEPLLDAIFRQLVLIANLLWLIAAILAALAARAFWN